MDLMCGELVVEWFVWVLVQELMEVIWDYGEEWFVFQIVKVFVVCWVEFDCFGFFDIMGEFV